jgi:hypothetical protein
LFKGTRRIPHPWPFNNINQQNFSFQDLLGITAETSDQWVPGGLADLAVVDHQEAEVVRRADTTARIIFIGQQGGINTTTRA